MAKRNKNSSPSPKGKKSKRLQAIYAKSRRDFSAADLQKFTVVEKGIPLEMVIADMEAIQENHSPKEA